MPQRETKAFVVQVVGEKPTYLGHNYIAVSDVQDARLWFSLGSAEQCRNFHPGLKVVPVIVKMRIEIEGA